MSDALSIYLNDHLAGANFGIHQIQHLRDTHADEPLGRCAAQLLQEVMKDRDTLRRLAEQAAAGGSAIKTSLGWIAEMASRVKLRAGDKSLGTFESLEMLSLGVLGKAALWDALASVAAGSPRLHGFDFTQLAARARAQHALIEEQRIIAARKALG